MNMRKKVFIITIGSLTALVILLLAGIIVLNGRKETRVYNGTTMVMRIVQQEIIQ